MTFALPEPAPAFDQPVAVLKHCHDRIRKQLSTLGKLLAHLPAHGADQDAQQAARSILAYFEKAAQLHHDDEEHDLIPMLQASASGDDTALLARLVPALLDEHRQMEAMWQRLRGPLTEIAEGRMAALAQADVTQFTDAYARHMVVEETQIAPMALRLFDAAQMEQLGRAMQERRGLVPAGERVAHMRKDYGQDALSEEEVRDDPIAQFELWFQQALQAEVNEPNAMSVATVGPDGRPSSRIVLVKQFDQRGFTWYTNYASQKGQELCANPHAALLFFWSELERQVRVEGKVERTSPEESDRYFSSRPLKSRLGAIASDQSQPIDSREALERNYEAVAGRFGEDPPRPEHWGGFRLVPERVEFWQGRSSRFHDRIVYMRQPDGSWTRQRLQP
ncbi:MAG TPA: pyridoxamine 5'-phosphate oxidase [Telluria sp.]